MRVMDDRHPIAIRARLGPAQGYTRPRVTTLSRHPDLKGALWWAARSGLVGWGVVWIEDVRRGATRDEETETRARGLAPGVDA